MPGGRPKSTEPIKTHRITVHLTEAEYKQIGAMAAERGVSQSQLLLRCSTCESVRFVMSCNSCG